MFDPLREQVTGAGLYTVSEEEAARLVPYDFVKLHIKGVEVTKAQYLEQMAAAFLLETGGIPATGIELVQQELSWPNIGWKFYYQVRRRTPEAKKAPADP